MSGIELGHVILPVADMDAALSFCVETLGLPLKFRDGTRYAALDAGRGTIALATPDEQPLAGALAIGLKVDDLNGVTERLRSAGASLVGEIVEGAHERRLTFRDPDGNVFVAYQPLLRETT